MSDYIIKAGDCDYLIWVESGTVPDQRIKKRYKRWIECDGHKWTWTGRQRDATRFEWEAAREVVWLKLKELTRCGLGTFTYPPRTNRWAYKLTRLVARGNNVRERSEAARKAAWDAIVKKNKEAL